MASTAGAYRTSGRTLPVLEDLRVAAPCDVSWDAMLGNGRERTCAECTRQVFNISGMTRSDAQLFLLERARGECIRFHRRADGTILTADCEPGQLRQRVRRRAVQVATVVAAGLAAVAAVFGLDVLREAVQGGTIESTQVGPATMGFAACDRPYQDR